LSFSDREGGHIDIASRERLKEGGEKQSKKRTKRPFKKKKTWIKNAILESRVFIGDETAVGVRHRGWQEQGEIGKGTVREGVIINRGDLQGRLST